MDRKPIFALFFILLLISPYPILAASVEKETARKRDKRVPIALPLVYVGASVSPWVWAALVAAFGAAALAVARVTRVCILFKRHYIYINLHHPAGNKIQPATHWLYFSYYSQKIDFDISCKLSS